MTRRPVRVLVHCYPQRKEKNREAKEEYRTLDLNVAPPSREGPMVVPTKIRVQGPGFEAPIAFSFFFLRLNAGILLGFGVDGWAGGRADRQTYYLL